MIQDGIIDVGKMMNADRKRKVRKHYVAPRLQHLSSDPAKGLLFRDADTNDSELQRIIEIDQLHGAKGS
jgi:hypothetical protein